MTALASCGRGGPETADQGRLLITHTENLSGNAALDGVARTVSHMVRAQLSGSRELSVSEGANALEPPGNRAGRVLRSWIEWEGDYVRLHATLRSASGRTLEQWESRALTAEGSSPLAGALVKKLNPRAKAAEPVPAQAASLFGLALEAPGTNGIPLLQSAVAAAPAWGDAYFLLGANLLAAGRADEARQAWSAGVARANDEIGRTRMQAALAAASRQPEQALAAAVRLAGLLPAEADVAMQAGEMSLRRGHYQQAAEWMKRAVDREASRGDWWNILAFTRAYAGDLAGAREAVARYQALEPASANPVDSLGEIAFMLGRFAEASGEFQAAYRKQPDFLGGATLLKSAYALLMAGKRDEARKEFERYAGGTAKGQPLLELTRARWEYRMGDKEGAARRAEALARAPGVAADVASASLTQLAFWRLTAGERTAAAEMARAAAVKAAGPAMKREAVAVLYMAQPSAPLAVWQERAKGNAPPDILAMALVFDGKWNDALPVLAGLLENTPPFQAGHWRVLYAWALAGSGQAEKARPWLRWYPVPLSSGDAMVETLVFDRLPAVRALVFGGKG
ncbi:MAG: tetratricopeptide repeat protein [Bryobacterales bacterium]|nr:tetratricopeptide repeat protein [Bryobacterales bacterium]